MKKEKTKNGGRSKPKKGRVLRVPGGQTQPPAATREKDGPEEVTAGFKAGRDLDA